MCSAVKSSELIISSNTLYPVSPNTKVPKINFQLEININLPAKYLEDCNANKAGSIERIIKIILPPLTSAKNKKIPIIDETKGTYKGQVLLFILITPTPILLVILTARCIFTGSVTVTLR